jgi:hypothetical protein
MPYPEYDDPDFYKKIFAKKEFFRTKAPPIPPESQISQYVKDVCNPKQFTIQNYQEFVRNFISSTTNYNGMLLFWGVGTGKTCGATQIAEGLKDIVKKLDKRIYVLTKKSVQPNFLKELYSKERESKETIPGSMQCTGDTYYIPSMGPAKTEQREKLIRDSIRKYYKFMGPRKFANFVDKEIKGVKPGTIGQYFSNCVFIIDEAHGLTKLDQDEERAGKKKTKRKMAKKEDTDVGAAEEAEEAEEEDIDEEEEEEEDDDDDEEEETKRKGKGKKKEETTKVKKQARISDRRIIDVFNEIFTDSEGIKLILLTATPMKDTAQDLTSLLDLLLRNDKRPPLNSLVPKKIQDQYHEFIPQNSKKVTYEDILFSGEDRVNEDLLKKLTRGYVSYVRGEHPASFPRVENITKDEKHPYIEMYIPRPILSDDGNKFLVSEYMKYIQVIKCPMSIFQYSNYLSIMKKKPETKSTGKPGREMKSTVGIQASNIIFPTKIKGVGAYGILGFKGAIREDTMKISTMTTKKTKGPKKDKSVKIYDYIQFDRSKGDDEETAFLHIDQVGKYSEKLRILLSNVINSEGIVYIYTDFVAVGANLIALMLEQNGYQRFTNDKLKNLGVRQMWNPKSKYTAKDEDMRCAVCGEKKGHHDNSWHKFKQATYVLFTGSEKYFSQAEIDIINNKENIRGETIKVIVGTRVSGEGIDYKMIKEVHITDPWHNNTRLYQVIGRAARFCSHFNFSDPKDRKVTVFRYCAAPPKDRDKLIEEKNYSKKFDKIVPESKETMPITFKELCFETSDEKVYRRIEKKDLFVKQVERVLKVVAVDCALNRSINMFDSYLKQDKDFSRECDYMKCNYTCEGFDGKEPPDHPKKINMDTYNLYFSEPQIARIQHHIISLFKANFVMKLDNIVYEALKKYPEVEREFIFEAIDRVVGHLPQKKPINFTDRFDRMGHLIYSKPYYVFQPNELSDEKAPLYYKTTPLSIKNEYINIESIKEKKNMKTVPDNVPVIEKTVQQETDIKEKIDELLKIDDKYKLHYALARIPPERQAIIYETFDTQFKKVHNDFIGKVNDYFIKCRKLYILSSSSGTEILGHHINDIIRIYDAKNKKWIDEHSDAQLASGIHRDIGKERAEERMKRPAGDIIGFVALEKGEYKFKIIDFKTENKKHRKADSKKVAAKDEYSIKSFKRGKFCPNYSVKEIDKFMKILKMDPVKMNRLSLCLPVELRCREMDDIDDEHRWFYSPDDLKQYFNTLHDDEEPKKTTRKRKVRIITKK